MRKSKLTGIWFLLLLMITFPEYVFAHGERAQMPQLRMRTVHWIDLNVSTTKLAINEELVVSGKFMPSKFWPHHVESIEGTSFLNIGVPGPSFVRLDSRVNGVPMIRSTSFKAGHLYDYEIRMRARKAGRYHVHPVINVKGTGPIIGPGLWVEVVNGNEEFSNTAETLLGKTIDLETYGWGNVKFWSFLWFAVGLSWFVYWLTKCPIIVPRFRDVAELGPAKADEILTPADRRIGGIYLVLTLTLIVGGYMYAQETWPITTPLQTGKVDSPKAPLNSPPIVLSVKEARYRIPGRSFKVEFDITNQGDRPLRIGEFAAGNLRFINSEVLDVQPRDSHDLVAAEALRVEGGPIGPGETKRITIYADDALWETERMTTMIASPDAVVAGLLHFFDDKGQRYLVEFGGPMIPVFG